MGAMNETTVKYIFLFLLGSSILNFAIAAIARVKTKNKDFNILLTYWPAVIGTFIVAGILRHSPLEIAFAYFFHIFSSNLYANIMISSLKLKVNWTRHICIQLATMGLSTYLLVETNAGFTNSLIPLCIAFSLPFYTPIKYALIDNRKESSWVEKSIAIVYMIGVVHHFNMAFFRLDPNAEAWGWAITIAEYQCMSIFLPLMINYRREKVERKNLQHAVEKISGNNFMESKTEELYKQLEFQISQKDMYYNELREINVQLKEEREMNEILIRTISHDLANPLTVIGAYIEILSTGKTTPENTEKIWERLKSNTQSALDMISRIRNAILTRTQASLVAVHDVSIDRSIKRTLEIFETRLKDKNLKVTYTNSTSPDTLIKAEENTLCEHVFANVISNAIKFSYPGNDIHINVTDQKDAVKVEIRDFGTGMQVSTNDKRILMSTHGTNGEVGTGFGLMVMGYFLRHFGATIDINSKTEGSLKGTCVSIMLQKSTTELMPIYSANTQTKKSDQLLESLRSV